jgi:hypothetical protein
MGRALVTLITPADKAKCIDWINRAPFGSRVGFVGPRRSLSQNSRFWAMLTDISQQYKHGDRYYTPDQWKVLFLHAIGREFKFLPSLDGTTVVPYGKSSSNLSKAEMAELMEFIEAWGAEHGVIFHDKESNYAESEEDDA